MQYFFYTIFILTFMYVKKSFHILLNKYEKRSKCRFLGCGFIDGPKTSRKIFLDGQRT